MFPTSLVYVSSKFSILWSEPYVSLIKYIFCGKLLCGTASLSTDKNIFVDHVIVVDGQVLYMFGNYVRLGDRWKSLHRRVETGTKLEGRKFYFSIILIY